MIGPKDTVIVPEDGRVELRCAHCGKWRVLAASRDKPLLLSDLLDWPLGHECPPARIT